MSKWFPAVTMEQGAREALKAGVFGALFASATCLLGLGGFLYGLKVPTPVFGQDQNLAMTGSGIEDYSAIIGIILELVLYLACAWRFRNGKGRYLGIFATAVLALEIANKLLAVKPNVGFLFMFAAIFVGMINGVRGAWALPKVLAMTGNRSALPE